MFWDNNTSPSLVHGISDCPWWPLFVLSECPTVLGDNVTVIDMHDVKLQMWKHVALEYLHFVTTDGFLFLRRQEVSCVDLDMLLECFLEAPMNIYHNMKHKREQAQKKMKKQQERMVEDESSEDEIEIVAIQVDRGSKHRHIKQEPDDAEPHFRQHPCLSLSIPSLSAGSSLSHPISLSDPPPVTSPSAVSCGWSTASVSTSMTSLPSTHESPSLSPDPCSPLASTPFPARS